MTEVMPTPASGRAAKAAAVPDGELFPVVADADALDHAAAPSDADAYEQHQYVPLDDDDYR
jgi:hypothetical protein